MKPDLASIVGLVVGVGMILLGQVLEGGSVMSIVQPTAALIVFGGTLGATMVSFPLTVVIEAAKKFVTVFIGKSANNGELVKELLRLANVSRREGFLSLQKVVGQTQDPFMAKGLQLIVDATPEKAIRDMLETEMTREDHANEQLFKVFETAGGYSPTIGIIGAVLGLIHVMENLADPSTLGAGIAVAFVATVYGVGSANLFFLPAASKLKHHKEEHTKLRELMLEGLLAIQRGENPPQMKERLKSYLSSGERVSIDKAA